MGVSVTDETAASGDAKSAVLTWDLPTLQQKSLLVLPQYMEINAVMSLEFDLHQAAVFYLLQRSGHLTVCDIRTPSLRQLHVYCHRGRPSTLRTSQNSHFIATSARGHEIKLWDLRRISEPDALNLHVQIYNQHESAKLPLGFDFLQNEKYIVTGSDAFYAHVYETLTGVLVRSMKIAPGQVVTTTATERDALSFYVVHSNGMTWGKVDTDGEDITHEFTSSEQIKEMYRHEAWETSLTKNNDKVLAAARCVQSNIGTNYEQMMNIIRGSDLPICKDALSALTMDYEACIEACTPRLVRDLQAFYAKSMKFAAEPVNEQGKQSEGRGKVKRTMERVVTERTVLRPQGEMCYRSSYN